jgi:hypothetical protein
MDCQGGTLGYSDIWYLQRGHSLSSAAGPVTPDILGVPAPSMTVEEAEARLAPLEDAVRADRHARQAADRSTGPACGNNPNFQMTDGDRQAVNDFRAYLELRATSQELAKTAVWADGDPLMEALAAAVWEHCHTEGTSTVADDPRNIAAVAASVVRAQQAADQTAVRAATLHEAAEALGRMDYDTDSTDYGYDTYRDAWNGGVMDAAAELRRLADEQPAPGTPLTAAQRPVHAVPLPGSNGISFCCGRPPCEFVGERVTRDPDEVTCPGPGAAPDGQ